MYGNCACYLKGIRFRVNEIKVLANEKCKVASATKIYLLFLDARAALFVLNHILFHMKKNCKVASATKVSFDIFGCACSAIYVRKY